MALTISDVTEIGQPQHVGAMVVRLVDIAWDTSYPTGGEPLTPGDVGLEEIVAMFVEPDAGIIAAYDQANRKLKAFWSGTAGSALDEVTNGTNLGLVSQRAMVVGL